MKPKVVMGTHHKISKNYARGFTFFRDEKEEPRLVVSPSQKQPIEQFLVVETNQGRPHP